MAGLIPRAMGVSDPDLARALQERDQGMERRARELGEQAVSEGRAWARRLGPPPDDPARREAWLQAVSTVAAFRERWGTGADPRPLGPEGAITSVEGRLQRRRAQAAAARALSLINDAKPVPDQGAVSSAGLMTEEGAQL